MPDKNALTLSTRITIVKNPHSTLPSALNVVEDSNIPTHVMILRSEDWEVVVDAKNGKLRKRKCLKFEPLPDYGNHMTWDAFSRMVADGGIEDEDGSGQYATATQMSNLNASLAHVEKQLPADFVVDVDENGHADIPKTKPPYEWVTPVVWFNK